MSRTTDSPSSQASENMPEAMRRVCPFCGMGDESGERPEGVSCPRCGMADTLASRRATQARIGPWHVRQVRNPWAPGMRWETLLGLVRRGQVTVASVVRGPTTQQLWERASHVKGLSREFGICFNCGEGIEKDANLCPHCGRMQEPPGNPDALFEREAGALPGGPVKREIPQHEAGARAFYPPAPVAPAERQPDHPTMPAPAPQSAGEPMGDALLSAKELAAAFQLDFSPGAAAPAPPKRQRRRGRLLAALVILAIPVAVVLYARPDYRAQAREWIDERVAALWEISRPAVGPATQPATRPVVKKTEPIVPPPAPKPEPAPAPVVEAPKPAAPPVPPPTAPAVDADEQARTLWRKAIDAEGNQDFVEAVKCYEQIKKLPADAQPAGLELRLEMARKQTR